MRQVISSLVVAAGWPIRVVQVVVIVMKQTLAARKLCTAAFWLGVALSYPIMIAPQYLFAIPDPSPEAMIKVFAIGVGLSWLVGAVIHWAFDLKGMGVKLYALVFLLGMMLGGMTYLILNSLKLLPPGM